jgi:hypothetical protein
LLGIGWVLLSLSSAGAVDKTAKADEAGTAVTGLRMSLSATGSATAGDLDFRLALENVGERDLTLNLGMMLANGKPLRGRALFPTNIRLELTDAAGKTRELQYMGPNVAGRVDDYAVQLRVGSSYTLRVPYNQFWFPVGQQSALELEAGDYQVRARYEGSGAMHDSGKFILNYWQGDVRSNAVTIRR